MYLCNCQMKKKKKYIYGIQFTSCNDQSRIIPEYKRTLVVYGHNTLTVRLLVSSDEHRIASHIFLFFFLSLSLIVVYIPIMYIFNIYTCNGTSTWVKQSRRSKREGGRGRRIKRLKSAKARRERATSLLEVLKWNETIVREAHVLREVIWI